MSTVTGMAMRVLEEAGPGITDTDRLKAAAERFSGSPVFEAILERAKEMVTSEVDGQSMIEAAVPFFQRTPEATAADAWDHLVQFVEPGITVNTWATSPYGSEARRIAMQNGAISEGIIEVAEPPGNQEERAPEVEVDASRDDGRATLSMRFNEHVIRATQIDKDNDVWEVEFKGHLQGIVMNEIIHHLWDLILTEQGIWPYEVGACRGTITDRLSSEVRSIVREQMEHFTKQLGCQP